MLIREPAASASLTRKVVSAVHRMRELDLAKPPGVAETSTGCGHWSFSGRTICRCRPRPTLLGQCSRIATTSTLSGRTSRSSPPVPDRADFTGVLAGFAGALRSAGLAVGTGDVLTYCAAAGLLDPADLTDLYWAGRTSLISRPEDIVTYDRVFRTFFLGEGGDRALPVCRRARSPEAEASLRHAGDRAGPRWTVSRKRSSA